MLPNTHDQIELQLPSLVLCFSSSEPCSDEHILGEDDSLPRALASIEQHIRADRPVFARVEGCSRKLFESLLGLCKRQFIPLVAVVDPSFELNSPIRKFLRILDSHTDYQVHMTRNSYSRICWVRPQEDKRTLAGPFDIVGDVHGCFEELRSLGDKLGYRYSEALGFVHPEQRRMIFVGDFVDRGPEVLKTANAIRNTCTTGNGLCVQGNHERNLVKVMRSGTDATPEQRATLAQIPRDQRSSFVDYLSGLPSHLFLDEGRLVVVHAAIKPEMLGRSVRAVFEHCCYGRPSWPDSYTGDATVVYGHSPAELHIESKTICVDTGCVHGGALSALRYPERECVSVASIQTCYLNQPA